MKNLFPDRTVKHGDRGVFVWWCMLASGLGNLVFTDVIMIHFLYLNILRNNLKLPFQNLGIGMIMILSIPQRSPVKFL